MAEKKGFFERVEAQVVGAAEDYVKEKVQKKVDRIKEYSILVFLGFFLIGYGVSTLMAFYFPILGNGISFMILGMILVLIAHFMKV